MEDAVVKTIAGFLNADGGTLFIGVDDQRQAIGLAHDLPLVKPANADGLVNWLTTHLINALKHPAVMRTRTRIDQVANEPGLPHRRSAVFGAGDGTDEREGRRVLGADEQQHPRDCRRSRSRSTSGTTGSSRGGFVGRRGVVVYGFRCGPLGPGFAQQLTAGLRHRRDVLTVRLRARRRLCARLAVPGRRIVSGLPKRRSPASGHNPLLLSRLTALATRRGPGRLLCSGDTHEARSSWRRPDPPDVARSRRMRG